MVSARGRIGAVVAASAFAVALVYVAAEDLSFGPPQRLAVGLIAFAAIVGLTVLRAQGSEERAGEWQRSIDSFSDFLGRVAPSLTAAAGIYANKHASEALPSGWSEIAAHVNWPADLRSWPLRVWRERAGVLTAAEEACLRIARNALNVRPDIIEFGEARRAMTRTVGQWVEWGRGEHKVAFRAKIAPLIHEWRNPLIALCFLEIAQAEANPHNDSVAGVWADLGNEWPAEFYSRDPIAPGHKA